MLPSIADSNRNIRFKKARQVVHFLYAISVSSIVALIASRKAKGDVGKAILYVTSSLVITVPLNLEYSDGSIAYIKLLCANNTILSQRLVMIFSLLLSSLTTFSGIKLSYDAVDKNFEFFNSVSDDFASIMKVLGVCLYASAVFNIRFKSACEFLNPDIKPQSLRTSFEVQTDLLLHDKFPEPLGSDDDALNDYYPYLLRNRIIPKSPCCYYSMMVIPRLSGLFLATYSIILFPLWLFLGQKGSSLISVELSKSDFFITSAAFSSMMFFFVTSYRYPLIAASLGNAVLNGEKTNNQRLGLFLTIVVATIFSWFSGSGFSQEAEDMVYSLPLRNATNPEAQHYPNQMQRNFINSFGATTIVLSANFFAGIVANGSSAVKYIMKKTQTDQDRAKQRMLFKLSQSKLIISSSIHKKREQWVQGMAQHNREEQEILMNSNEL